ncbi:hypothetical protein BAMA_15055 [Bacillus manliponensis]|uniref:DUF4166 domain-containing protein n=1 Tax=Bacillus manliponensis TaxID=574376 RepID=A0A073K2C3_9BACI|nr:DUF4166 domain-containing protein [Bacillus manliponensis]KEK20721.1 hypothetical protein BAMA_15055 [Bacillus manliponensis]
MSSIYKKVLGEEYQRLHPKLQERYKLTEKRNFTGDGIMDEIAEGSKLVKVLLKIAAKFRMFFSERGETVPFTIHNTVEKNEKGEAFVRWNRMFLFGDKKRYFHAVMYLDEKNGEIIDYFGEPHLLISTLKFSVDNEGAMHISSNKQWLHVFGMKVKLPTFLHGKATIVESFDEEKGCFRIQVRVENLLLGPLFSYKGTFIERVSKK